MYNNEEINRKYNNQIKKLGIIILMIFVSFTFASMLLINEIFASTSSTKNHDGNKFLSGTNVSDVNWGKVINATLAALNQTQNVTNEVNKNFTFIDQFDLASKVVTIVDGDTIDLASGERIRLSIVNTPERGQVGFKEAKQFTKDLCLGKDALIDIDSKQKLSFNRVVAVVYCDGVFLNKELLDKGHGQVLTKFCNKSEFKKILCNK